MGSVQFFGISKLGLNRKIKKFSDSFIGGKGYSPPEGGENSFAKTRRNGSAGFATRA